MAAVAFPPSRGISDEEPPRKKVRKGTHSCLECKRRKVRCVVPSDGGSICKECISRGTSCVSQEYELSQARSQGKRQNVRDRVGRLEGLVESLLHRVGGQPMVLNSGDVAAAQMLDNMASDVLTPSVTSSDSSIEQGGQFQNAPVLSLFNNDVLRRRDDDNDVVSPASTQASSHPAGVCATADSDVIRKLPLRHEKIRDELLAALPAQKDMETIFTETERWWCVWRELVPFLCGSDEHLSPYQHALRAISSGHPTLIGYVMLCLAVSLQQLPSDYDRSRLQLTLPLDELMAQYTNTVERLIVSNDELAGTFEGLQCALLLGKFQLDLGRPRQSWIICRRAQSLAQLMGLHRTPRGSRNEPDGSRTYYKRCLWWVLFSIERYLSLLLGLPSGTTNGPGMLEVDEHTEGWVESSERFRRKLGVISGSVIELNQTTPVCRVAVIKIDEELDELARSVPETWWSMQHAADTLDIPECFGRIMAQFWFFQIRALAHLPHMLASTTEPKHEHSRFVCINSSREMIRRYYFIRKDTGGGSYLCKVVDFQAFTATVLLLLNLLGYRKAALAHEGPRRGPLDEEEKDWEMVHDMIEVMRRASCEAGSIVASQALKALETLCMGRNRASDIWEENTVKLVIPYFGTICIGQGSHLRDAHHRGGGGGGGGNGGSSGVGNQQSQQQQVTPPSTTDITPITDPRASNVQGSFFTGQDLADDGIISFSNLLALAPAGSEQTREAHENGDDTLFYNSVGFDLDQDWNWILNGAAPYS